MILQITTTATKEIFNINRHLNSALELSTLGFSNFHCYLTLISVSDFLGRSLPGDTYIVGCIHYVVINCKLCIIYICRNLIVVGLSCLLHLLTRPSCQRSGFTIGPKRYNGVRSSGMMMLVFET